MPEFGNRFVTSVNSFLEENDLLDGDLIVFDNGWSGIPRCVEMVVRGGCGCGDGVLRFGIVW